MVEGHLGEEMVDDMIMCNVVKKEAALPAQEVAVDSSCRPPLEVPFLGTVMRECSVGVVQISDHDEPMANRQPRKPIVLRYGSRSVERARVLHAHDHCSYPKVGKQNDVSLISGEKDRVGAEVVCPFRIRFLPGNVEEEVGRESKDLLANEHVERINRGVSEEFVPVDIVDRFVRNAEIFPCLGYIDLVSLHRRMSRMMAMV